MGLLKFKILGRALYKSKTQFSWLRLLETNTDLTHRASGLKLVKFSGLIGASYSPACKGHRQLCTYTANWVLIDATAYGVTDGECWGTCFCLVTELFSLDGFAPLWG